MLGCLMALALLFAIPALGEGAAIPAAQGAEPEVIRVGCGDPTPFQEHEA